MYIWEIGLHAKNKPKDENIMVKFTEKNRQTHRQIFDS